MQKERMEILPLFIILSIRLIMHCLIALVRLHQNTNELVVLNQFVEEGGMKKGFSIVHQDGDGWSFPEPVGIDNYHNSGTDVSMNMSHDGKCIINGNGTWRFSRDKVICIFPFEPV